MPKFSIIVPCYKIASIIDDLFLMLKNDNFEEYEVIFIDDCSPDNSYNLMQNNKNKAENYIILKNEINSGPGEARNLGLKFASGEFILFCDSDDYFDIKVLDKISTFLDENKNIDTLVFPYKQGYKKFKTKDFYCNFNTETQIPSDFAALEAGMVWAKLFSSKVIRENNLQFPNLKMAEDKIFWTYYCCYANGIYKCDFSFYTYVKNRGSLTHTLGVHQEKTPFEFLQPIYHKYFPNIEARMFADTHLYYSLKRMTESQISASEISKWLKKENCKYPNWIDMVSWKSQNVYKKIIYNAMFNNNGFIVILLLKIRKILY